MKSLLVTDAPVGDVTFGGGQRTERMQRALRLLGPVHTLVLQEGDADLYRPIQTDSDTTQFRVRAAPAHRRYSNDARLIEWFNSYRQRECPDVVVGRSLAPICRLPVIPDLAFVVDADDSVYRYAPNSDSALSTLLASAKTLGRRMATSRTLRRFRHCWLASERDQRLFPLIRSSVLPNVVPLPAVAATEPAETPSILFVGALWYRPNLIGLQWFLSHCWGEIRRQCPQATLRVVGAAPPPLRDELGKLPGVVCAGFVPSLEAEYRNARLAIAPIWYGGGTQIKVLEALSYGIPCVTTAFVGAAYAEQLKEGESLLVAASASQFAAQCTGLLHDRSAARSLGLRGRSIIATHFTEQAFFAAVAETMRALGMAAANP